MRKVNLLIRNSLLKDKAGYTSVANILSYSLLLSIYGHLRQDGNVRNAKFDDSKRQFTDQWVTSESFLQRLSE